MSSATTDSYNNAISLLDDRYGDPFLISGAFRKKLKDWPTVPPHDGESLRLLSDFLRQCLSVQKSYNRLNILNDEQELRSVFLKLPEYLQNRWARINRNCKVSQGRYPTFEEFSLFVQDTNTKNFA